MPHVGAQGPKLNRKCSNPSLDKQEFELPVSKSNSQILVHVNSSILKIIMENTKCKRRLPHNTFPDEGNVLYLVLAFTSDPSSYKSKKLFL